MFRNQIASLVLSERIVTTLPKAKELRPIAEKVITQGKRGTVHARRIAARWVSDRDLLKKLSRRHRAALRDRAGRLSADRQARTAPGDGAEMAILEFVDFEFKPKEAPAADDKKGKGKKAKAEAAEGGEPEAAEEKKATTKRKASPKAGKSVPQQKTDAKSKARPSTQQKPKGGTRSGGGRKSGGE
jgi:large subunit ribosomal protein L17